MLELSATFTGVTLHFFRVRCGANWALKSLMFSYFLWNPIPPHVRESGSLNPGNFAFGIRNPRCFAGGIYNPGYFACGIWNPGYFAFLIRNRRYLLVESGIRDILLVESGTWDILLVVSGIRDILLVESRFLAPVVQTLDSAIHRINNYPADKY